MVRSETMAPSDSTGLPPPHASHARGMSNARAAAEIRRLLRIARRAPGAERSSQLGNQLLRCNNLGRMRKRKPTHLLGRLVPPVHPSVDVGLLTLLRVMRDSDLVAD